MKEKKFKKEKYLLAIAISIINFVFIYFIFVNLKAVIIEQKIDLKKDPLVKLEKIDFYKRNIYLLNNLISLIPQNAEYLIKKADCLRMAMDDGFKELFSIQDKEIEELYQKAIFLNPLNFEYHLKLGWFYIDKDTNKAKKEFLSSIELNPTDFHPYLYFSIYHLKNKDGKQAFINIISALYFKASPQKIIEEVIPQIKDDLNLVFDDKKRELKFVAFPKEEIWDFKKEGFPQIKIPINIRVYIKGSMCDVKLYRGNYEFKDFKFLENKDDFNIYEFNLNDFPTNTYLNDFKIRTFNCTDIEKIELIKKF